MNIDNILHSLAEIDLDDLVILSKAVCDEIRAKFLKQHEEMSAANGNDAPNFDDDEKSLLQEGDRLEAVRRYRNRTGNPASIALKKYFESISNKGE